MINLVIVSVLAPVNLLTRLKAKKFKRVLNGLIQTVQKDTSSKMFTAYNEPIQMINIIQVSSDFALFN